MELTLAIPENQIYNSFISKKDDYKNHTLKIIRTSEQQCFNMLINNKVQVSLLTPYGYGQGLVKSDLRIIPGTALGAIGYTGLATIVFNKGIRIFKTLTCNDKNDFVSIISKIILAERYSLLLNLVEQKGTNQELPANFETAIIFGKGEENVTDLDLTEDWLDTYEMPLPLAFWVCKADLPFENIPEILTDIFEPVKMAADIIKSENDAYERQGKFIWQWNNEMENALEQTLQLLFFHQFLPEIPAIKIWGRD
ncbi:MAG: MqnA/MqnD/SBP family protein [FCB group bacterium]